MPFLVQDIEQESFKDWESLNKYIKKEAKKYVLLPIEGFFKNNSKFIDDEYYGNQDYKIKFNEEGFGSFCKLLNIPLEFINKLEEQNLVSNILNDYIKKDYIKKKLNNYQFVLDEDQCTVSGLVSRSYVDYSNNSFINDITQVFPELFLDFELSESYISNTNLYLRLLSPKYKAGIITGRGGNGEDISRIGIQLSNGMTGNKSISASFFIYRLVCSNGLIVKSMDSSGLVMHSGKRETLQERLGKNIMPVIEKIKNVPNQIKTLGNIQFDVEKFVLAGGAKLVYDIIPIEYYEQLKRGKLKGDKKIEFDIVKLHNYINSFAMGHSKTVFHSYYRDNQSMFDFVNIFTEYAHTQKPREKVYIEEKSGDLANWILKNKKKFN